MQSYRKELDQLREEKARASREVERIYRGLVKPREDRSLPAYPDVGGTPIFQTMEQYPDRLEMRLGDAPRPQVVTDTPTVFLPGLAGWIGDRVGGYYITLWRFVAGTTFPLHFHTWEERFFVIEGTFRFIMRGREHLLTERHRSITSPPNVPHGGTAVTDCLMVLVIPNLGYDC